VRKLGCVNFLQLGFSLAQARVITRDEDVVDVGARSRPSASVTVISNVSFADDSYDVRSNRVFMIHRSIKWPCGSSRKHEQREPAKTS